MLVFSTSVIAPAIFRCILQQHMIRHTGRVIKCTKEGCLYKARSNGELTVHLATHSEERQFSCDVCPYQGKTKLQLKRFVLF